MAAESLSMKVTVAVSLVSAKALETGDRRASRLVPCLSGYREEADTVTCTGCFLSAFQLRTASSQSE